MLPTQCPILCDPRDCSPSGSPFPGILQARRLEWVDIPFSRVSSQPRDRTQVSCIADGFFTNWAIMTAWKSVKGGCNLRPTVLLQLDHKMDFLRFRKNSFWLRWVFVAACELYLVAVSGSYFSLRFVVFSLQWLFLLWSTYLQNRAQYLQYRGLVALRHVGSSQTRDHTSVPCIARRILKQRPQGKTSTWISENK